MTLPEDYRRQVIEIGRWLEAGDEAAKRYMLDPIYSHEVAGQLSSATLDYARQRAMRELDGLAGLRRDDVAIIRAQAVMAGMLAKMHPEHAEALSQIEGELATAATALRTVSRALAEERAAA